MVVDSSKLEVHHILFQIDVCQQSNPNDLHDIFCFKFARNVLFLISPTFDLGLLASISCTFCSGSVEWCCLLQNGSVNVNSVWGLKFILVDSYCAMLFNCTSSPFLRSPVMCIIHFESNSAHDCVKSWSFFSGNMERWASVPVWMAYSGYDH